MTPETESLERTLPGGTADLGRARLDLDRFGYAIVKDVLTPKEVSMFRSRTVALETSENKALLKRLGYTIQYGLGRIEKPTEAGLLSRGRGALEALGAQGRPLAAAS